MNITRRNFLAAAPVTIGAVAGLSSIATGQTRARTAARTVDPLARLTSDSFLPYVGTEFLFRVNGSDIRLTLNELEIQTPGDYVSSGRGEECFALKFRGSARSRLSQDSYAVEHFALGSFSIFITEAGSVNGSRAYEAVFNRLSH